MKHYFRCTDFLKSEVWGTATKKVDEHDWCVAMTRTIGSGFQVGFLNNVLCLDVIDWREGRATFSLL